MASSFTLNPAGELRFKSKPNFESPTDANNDNSYKVSIVAIDKAGLRNMRDVSIKVNNVDEPGEVKLSTIQPGVGQEITATVTDPDGGVNSAMWEWQSATSDGAGASFAPIDARHVDDLHASKDGSGRPGYRGRQRELSLATRASSSG